MSSKNINLKAKQKIKNKFHGYYLVHLVLCFSTYLFTYVSK